MLQLNTTDEDKTSSGNVSLLVQQGNDLDLFTIEDFNLLVNAEKVDLENKSADSYVLILKVKDVNEDGRELFDTAVVIVEVNLSETNFFVYQFSVKHTAKDNK